MRRRQATRSIAILAAASVTGVYARSVNRPLRVGYLGNALPTTAELRAHDDAFRSEMRRLGWVEGSNIVYEFRFAEGVQERYIAIAREFVSMRVDLIAAMGTAAATFAKQETSTIPIVFIAAEPVEYGLVASLARPGGNLTGFGVLVDPLMGKRMQILTQAVSGIRRIAYLGMNESKSVDIAKASAKTLQRELLLAQVVERPEDLPSAISSAPSADAWLVDDYPMFTAHRGLIIELLEAQRKPTVFSSISWMREGGLMAYSADTVDMRRRAAGYVDRILRGVKPRDLPVQEPVRYLLGINLRTAHRLGITLARSVLLQADELIQ